MTNDLNNKYVRQDVFNVIMKGIDEKLENIHQDLEEIKTSKNNLNWRLILIFAVLALGGGGVGSGVFAKLLEALAK